METINQTKLLKSGAGFTLIELLVVIAVIGLLASVVLVALNSSRIKARDTKRKADLRQVATALNLYYNENNFLPGNAGWCASFNGAQDAYGFDGSLMPAPLLTQYMSKIPSDPLRPTSGRNGNYLYFNDLNAEGKFTLCALMERDQGNGASMTCSSPPYNYCISQ